MRDKDIQKILLAAKRGPYNHVISDLIRGWSYEKLSSVIAYCRDRGFVEAIEVTHFDSPHREFILQGITADGEDYLQTSSLWSRIGRLGWKLPAMAIAAIAILAEIVTILAWSKTPILYHHLIDKVRHIRH